MISSNRIALAGVLAISIAGLLPMGCADRDPRAAGRAVQAPKEMSRPSKSLPVPLDKALASAARQELSTAVKAQQPAQRAHAIEALQVAVGASAASEILPGLSDSDPTVRFAAAMACGELKLADAQAPLMAIVEDKDASVRIAVRFALHRLGVTTYSHELEQTAVDSNPRLRCATADVLGRLGEPSATNILLKLHADPHPAVRQVAAEALWRMGNEEGMQDLVGLLASRYRDDEMSALLGLAARPDARLTEEVRAKLTTASDDGQSEDVHLVAARVLALTAKRQKGAHPADLCDPGISSPKTPCDRPEMQIGSDKFYCCAHDGPFDLGYDIAKRGAGSSESRLRVLAALAFGAIGRTDAQPMLAALLKDADADVRGAAAAAILQINAVG